MKIYCVYGHGKETEVSINVNLHHHIADIPWILQRSYWFVLIDI